MEFSLVSFLNNIKSISILTIAVIVILGIVIIQKILKVNLFGLIQKIVLFLKKGLNKKVDKAETRYSRELEIGKINNKKVKVKLYKFLSELIVDLSLSSEAVEVTPYTLLYTTIILVTIVVLVICKMLFDSIILGIILVPLGIIATFCIMYTKANLAHDARIEAVILAENMICNDINLGVVGSVRGVYESLPKEVKGDFKEFLDNIEFKSYHIKEALNILNSRLGSIADDFIKKCIEFEINETIGMDKVFQDIVEINNIKTKTRINMKRKFEEAMNEFKISAAMIFIFLAGVIAIFPDVRKFYFNNFIGQIILCIDILILISEFVYITYLRAQEL